ncbi:MAG: FG-GAP repeat protein [Thermoanaerobaculia bacterium]
MRRPFAPVICSTLWLFGIFSSSHPGRAVTFMQEARLTASDAAAGDAFGDEVALSSDGTVALVGASGRDCAGGANCGAGYVFVRSGGGWSQQARLTASDATAGADLGHALALSGDGSTALLRARSTDCLDSPDCAVAYVFRHLGGSWTETAKLKTSGPFPTSAFLLDLRSMALSEDGRTAILGAPSCPQAGPCGMAHIYVWNGESWSEETRLMEGDAAYQLGESVDLSKDGLTALVGVTVGPEEPGVPPRIVGAYVYVRSGGTWVRQQRLAPVANDFLTIPVVPFREVTLSGDGNTALLSSPNGGCGHQLEDGVGYCGVLRTFVRTGGSWTEQQFLGILNTFGFGFRAALSGDGTIAMTTAPGAVLYEKVGDTWILRQRGLAGQTMSLSADGRTALTGVTNVACSTGDACGAAFIYAPALGIIDVPTLGGPGLAVLTIALILSALILLQRRRSI